MPSSVASPGTRPPGRGHPAAAGRAQPAPLTARSLLLGCGLIILNALWIAQMEAVKAGGRTTTFSIFFVAVFDLFVLIGWNRLAERFRPRWVLSAPELVTVYVMMNLGIALVGTDLLQVIVPIAGHPVYRATPENRWASLFIPHLPGWLVMRDWQTARDLYAGNNSFWTAAHLRHWAPVIAGWTALLMLMLWVMLCLNRLLRRAWTEQDRLAFPLVVLPLEMVRPRAALFRSRSMWTGFGLAAAVTAVNAVHVLAPAVPEVPVAAREIQKVLVDPPWNAIGRTHVSFFPWAIGLGFLLPADLLFSGCFFFWFWKFLRVGLAAHGMAEENPQAPWVAEHTLGGYLAVCAAVLWHARRTFASVVRGAGRGPRVPAEELRTERRALLGAVIGSLLLVGFGIAAGLSPVVAVVYMALFLAVSITITRIRGEFGAPVHDFAGDPGSAMVLLYGAKPFLPRELAAFTAFFGFTRIQRGNLMPLQLEGFKMADRTGADRDGLSRAILLAGLVGVLAGFAALLTPYYALGLGSAKVLGPHATFTNEAYPRLATWLQSPPKPEAASANAVGVGFAFTLFLAAVRLRVVGFPFHPVGFAVSGSWNMSLLWLPLAVAWLIKVLVLRYGGLRLYQQFLPFFLGLMLGDFVSTSVANLLAIWLDLPVYSIYAS